MKTIFVVDDDNTNLITAEETLSDYYQVFTLPSASAMFKLLKEIIPDLILLDILMPEMTGFDALEKLKANIRYTGIPIVLLTSKNDPATEALGFEMGAKDFISKPFSGPVLINRIKTHLEIESIIRERTEMLQQRTEMLQHRTEKLLKLQNSMVSVLANMIENRDKLTGKHVERTTKYMKILLKAMINRGVYSEEINNQNVDAFVSSSQLHDIGVYAVATQGNPANMLNHDNLELFALSARLHDIGKIAISDLILNKPAKLTPEEYELIKTHTTEGEKIIETIIQETGDEAFLQNAKLFAGGHHERWDGTGYPRGLKGIDIPLQGRIMAIVDVYDALLAERPYKKGYPHSEAVEIIRESRGSHFDPKIVDVFLEVNELFAELVTE